MCLGLGGEEEGLYFEVSEFNLQPFGITLRGDALCLDALLGEPSWMGLACSPVDVLTLSNGQGWKL